MSLIARLDAARSERNVLEHPLYTRWERGELTRGELAYYAGQYRYAVEALAHTAESAAPLAGEEHAREERDHVTLWDAFADELGADHRPANPQTRRCAAAWTSASDPLEALAILYAIEAGQPEVSKTKLEGLVKHYGFELSGEGTAYFELHATKDLEHAAHSKALLKKHAPKKDEDRLVAAAQRALEGNWQLLDGVAAKRA